MRVRFLIIWVSLIGVAVSCKKEKDEAPLPTTSTDSRINYSLNSIAGLHERVFAPTCANSGCHDGAFPPDFRTIESSYNTLVMQPSIKNNVNNDYPYRVKPMHAEQSVLYRRLIEDIDGQSGIMPLELNPDSDYERNKQLYINSIVEWINAGAPDIFGNNYQAGNNAPQMKGVLAFANGSSTPLSRNAGDGAIEVPQNTSEITLWFALTDDHTSTENFTTNAIKFSGSSFEFENEPMLNLTTGSSIQGMGYFNETVSYTHQITIDPSVLSDGIRPVFFRIYVGDGSQEAEIPSNGSPDYIKVYFSFKLF